MKDCEAVINQSYKANEALQTCWPWLEWDVFLVKFNSQLKASLDTSTSLLLGRIPTYYGVVCGK